jgi:hypothetical protein
MACNGITKITNRKIHRAILVRTRLFKIKTPTISSFRLGQIQKIKKAASAAFFNPRSDPS